ncbi:PAS domain-containing protein [Streptomyces sp. CA-132043]|uniref:PAS domain-containing protein n=1 Tax=Streptomyces sp. CA-132043 TaxID=3240048 RepID=UPI003D8BD8A5
MPNDQRPSVDQLIDVIANSSVGITVTDRSGAVVLHNRAQSVLMGGEADHLGGRILLDGSADGLQELIQRLEKDQRVENVQVTYRGIDGRHKQTARVNAVLTGSGADTHIHWVSRPELGERLPVSNNTVEDVTSDAATWIRAVNARPLPTLAPPRTRRTCCASSTRSPRWRST